MILDLIPVYEACRSYYGKARVRVDEDGTRTLISYNTPVARYKGGKVELLPDHDYSVTTKRHVKEFTLQCTK